MTIAEILVVLIVILLVTKPSDIPVILKYIKTSRVILISSTTWMKSILILIKYLHLMPNMMGITTSIPLKRTIIA